MELLLIPVLLVAGLTFVLLGANGMAAAEVAFGPMSSGGRQGNPAAPRSWFSRRQTKQSNGQRPEPMSTPQTSEVDVLLADLMTEMIEFRTQMDSLRRELGSLKSGEPASTVQKKRSRRTKAA